MTANRRNLFLAAGLSLAAAAIAIPGTAAFTAQVGEAPKLAYDLSYDVPDPGAAAVIAVIETPVDAARSVQLASVDADSLECMSKVVHHEAKNQPRRGQLAVAQALVNRLHAGRFGGSICEVTRQRGQFFNVAAYSPPRDTDAWEIAEDVSREALAGSGDQVAPGAMFFRASYAPANSFFRTRQRVAAVGGHIFYR